jgi:acetyl esterase/lipase
MRRREFVFSLSAAACLRAAAEPQTVVYKNAGGCEIKADIYAPSTEQRKPLAVWIHGGALISGSRRLGPNSRVLQSLLAADFAVISIDYRLAPETKLPGIIEDVQDAFRWMRADAKKLNINAEKIAVCGGSAGGYLTLMTGFAVKPRPAALVSYWGYGDIVGPWYSRPDPFYLRQPKVTREDALQAVGSAPISEPELKNNRGRFYLYCRQQGLWPNEVAGRDPAKEDRWFDRYCPIRNMTRSYPPTMLIHGTADTDVPYEQSTLMADRFRQAGVEHQLVSVPDGSHGIGNIAAEEQDQIYREAAMFLKKRVS